MRGPLLAPRQSPISYPNYFKELKYPLLCSPKLDGIRAIIKDNIVMSRTMKPLPSYQVQEEFSNINHFDGELIVGDWCAADVCNKTQSHVMSKDKPADVSYHIFDYTSEESLLLPFKERLGIARIRLPKDNKYQLIQHTLIEDYHELLDFEDAQLKLGFEGIMMRNPDGIYKHHARCTFKDNIIYKLKRFEDVEAVVVDLYEQMDNNNALETDERGYAKRSDAKANKVPGGMVGGFIVDYNGQILDVAPGNFTKEQKIVMWNFKEDQLGKLLKFRFMRYGMKDKPRFPRAIGWRSAIDV